MSDVAVVGGTGTIGGRLVGQLAARGHDVRAIARDPADADQAAEQVAADMTDPDQADRALKGATSVYLTPAEAGDDPLGLARTISRNVIAAATEHDVEHLVVHTAVQGDRGDTGAGILDNMTPIERAVADSGIGYTILRPAWFLQNLWMARDYLEQGVVSMPWPGDMVWAGTDVNDVVQAAVAFLERGPANRGFDVHIPGGITGEQIAAAASRVLDHDVSYQQAEASTREYVESFPISDPHKDLYAELFDYFQATTYLGDPEPVTDALDGLRYRSVEDFLRDELFAAS